MPRPCSAWPAADHQTQVRLNRWRRAAMAVAHHDGQITLAAVAEALTRVQQVLGIQAGLDALGQLHLVLGGQQRGLSDPVEIHAHKVGGGALGVQIAVSPGSGGVAMGASLIGWRLSNFPTLDWRQVPHASAISHPLNWANAMAF